MKIDAATRTVAKAEARERAKVMSALNKWLPMRLAQLALEKPGADVAAQPDARAAHELVGAFIQRMRDDAEPDVEVTPS